MQRVLTLAAVAAVALTPSVIGQTPSRTVIFENVNVVPMDRERVIARQTVIVRDGRIAEIAPASDVKAPAGALRVDGSGKYLMPGLAEMHGHLTANYLPEAARADILYLYVANGVTTVRAMLGNPDAITTRDAIDAGTLLGPKLYVAGPALNGKVAPTPEDGARIVREQKHAGYDLVKILGGMPAAVYESIMRTAHSVKIDVAGHVPSDVGVRGALAARQRSIDHLDQYIPSLKLTPGTSWTEEDRRIAELARLTAKSGVWNVPTMYLWDLFHNAETGVRVMELRRKIVKALKAANAPIALGTDSPQMFSVPGFSTYRELKLMVGQLGYTPYEALASGTLKVAEYFGTTAETGTVAEGKRADLILLNANPLTHIANAENRAGVMVNGRWLPESDIQKRLAEIAARAATM